MSFDPAYPNDTTLAYKRGFLAGCELGGLTKVPDTLLSHAIDRALGTTAPPEAAGRVLGLLYFLIIKRSKIRRGQLMNFESYLLAAFEDELKRLDNHQKGL